MELRNLATEPIEATFDDTSGRWRVELRGKDGAAETIEANALISAVGQLNRPKWLDIPGQDRYKGIAFHSTQWEHEHDLAGGHVPVIGTGASAFQFAPEVAREGVAGAKLPAFVERPRCGRARWPPWKPWT